jgi:hypothetical protein
VSSDDTRRRLLTGRAAELPEWEQALIVEIATKERVDPAALAALRIIENGSAGREFGVLSVPAPTYEAQAEVAARSFRNHERRYTEATGATPVDYAGRYTDDFLRHFSARWAPIGAENDPRGLNNFHAGNLVEVYSRSATA